MSGEIEIPKKSKSYLKNFFKSLDNFDVSFTFQIDKEATYQSLFGGVIYFLFFLYVVIYFSLNFMSFVGRSNLTSTLTNLILDTSPPMNFQNLTLGMAIGLRPTPASLQDEIYNYIKITVTYTILSKTGGKTKIPVNLTYCNTSHFYNLNATEFEILNLKNYLCPDLTYDVQGIFTDATYIYYQIVGSLQPNLTSTQIARAETMLKQNSINAEIYFTDTSMNIYDYKSPIKKFFNSQFIKLGWEYQKTMNLYFVFSYFVSDDNMWLSSPISTANAILWNIYEYFEFAGNNRENTSMNAFFKMYITSLNRINTTTRVYQKFPPFLADTSSMISIIILILYVIVHQINVYKGRQSIVKKIMKIRENFGQDKLIKNEDKSNVIMNASSSRSKN